MRRPALKTAAKKPTNPARRTAVAGRLSRCLPCIKAEAARARDASQKAHADVAALANQKVEVI